MRVGVLTAMQHSMFSGGAHGLSITMAEAMRALGHEVDLINTTDATWWDDCQALASDWKVVPLASAAGYDLCIEPGPILLRKAQRIANRHVWVLATPFLQKEIELSIFQVAAPLRELPPEAWLMEETNTEDDCEALRVLGVKARLIPYMWSPSLVAAYSAGFPAWTPGPWRVHIIETHTSNTTSAVLPLIIANEIVKRGTPIANVRVHNADAVSKSKFFKENTLGHCRLPIDFLGRQRLADFLGEAGSCVIAHSRFRGIRPALLDLAWLGIPFIHNLMALKDVAPYYEGNRIGQACAAFSQLGERPLEAARTALTRWSPSRLAARLPVLAPTPAKRTFRVGFCDMWENFNPEYNFFTLLLSAHAPELLIVGGPSKGADVVIFGPFGTSWQNLPQAQPKVHFTGENTGPLPADLNLGFQHRDMDPNYLRFPLWLLEIDWFGADKARLRNPIPIPLDLCVNSPVSERSKFCAFVASNPANPIRNAAFQTLAAWKPVDSAGALFNNMGPALFAGAGGGGGEARKVDFLKAYRFCITYENDSSPGYCTEKLLHAKAAGCVPIYWGDPRVERDFNLEGCIDARAFRTPEELVAAVRAVEENPEEWRRRAAIPALDDYKVEWAKRTMSELAKRIFSLKARPRELPVFVINLDRRPDRLQRLGVKAQRWPAVDGRALKLTPELRTLLAPNDFFWKKGVAGCALSHLGLWKKVAAEGSALILEDDAVLRPGWQEALKDLPADLDILYLGGVLPPNKAGFEHAVEPYGSGAIGRIKPNQLFGQPTPSRYFHFCAYAYYLTAKGAQKVVAAVNQRGIWTSADHILCSPEILTAYVARPLVAGCYQDEDPAYQTSKFNDFSRIDTFDSDLWNNDERFGPSEIAATSETVIACAEPLELSGLYEYEWLCEVLDLKAPLAVVPLEDAPAGALVITQGPYMEKTAAALKGRTTPFRLLHLSDERCRDPVEIYDHPACTQVIRNYHRKLEKEVLTIPLGYHWRPCPKSLPKLPFRTKTWSFVGTDWNGREGLRELPSERSVLRLFHRWQDPANLSRSEYLGLLLDSVFAPCPSGNNPETFRIYEALECGTVPLVIGWTWSTPLMPEALSWAGLPLLPLHSWKEAGECMAHLLSHVDQLEQYREKLFSAWNEMKAKVRQSIRTT
jgi:alpha(1,3/1,4) fucosyltransferase